MSLLAQLVTFGRELRKEGLKISPEQLALAGQALGEIDLLDAEAFFLTLRATLVSRHEDYPLFERLFWRFWQGLLPLTRSEAGKAQAELQLSLLESSLAERAEPAPSYSPQEVLRTKPFERMSPEELQEVSRIVKGLRFHPPQRLSRRREAFPWGKSLDLRRSLRQALRTQGEALTLRWRRRKQRPRLLVLIADLSGSMEAYARPVLTFLYALSQGREIESFALGTRLTRITPALRRRGLEEALAEVSYRVQDRSGGTRIGACLHTFNRRWGRRVLGRGAWVLLISDGWDQGEPELLAQEMARLRRTSSRLFWLNPLIGSPGYQPLTRGLQAALPYVDHFLSVRNLASLEELLELLKTLTSAATTPSRRSAP
jgi:uncharacterized protein with von Willebrand factor type A (vWA) domain